MSTHCEILLLNPDATFTHIYVHFDGYPAHMLPALNNLTNLSSFHKVAADLRACGEVRGITEGSIDPLHDATPPEVSPTPLHNFEYSYLYDPEAGQWNLVPNPDAP